jgi:hypothetical protein
MATIWNPADNGGGLTLSGGNLTAAASTSNSLWESVRSTNSPAKTAGKWHAEFTVGSSTLDQTWVVGIADSSATLSGQHVGETAHGVVYSINASGAGTDVIQNNVPTSYTATNAVGDVIALEIDIGNSLIWFQNVTKASGWTDGSGGFTGNPGAGTGGTAFTATTAGGIMLAFGGFNYGGGSPTCTLNTTTAVGTVSSGFLVWDAIPEFSVSFIARYKTSVYAKPRLSWDTSPTLPNQGPLVANPHFITRYRPPVYAKPRLSWDTSPTLPNQGPLVANPHFIGRYKPAPYARPKLSEDAATTLPPQIEAQPHFISRYRTPIYARPRLSEDAATTLPPQIEAEPHFIARYQQGRYQRPRTSEDALPPQLEAQPHFISRYRTPIYARPKLSEDEPTTLHIQGAFSTVNVATGQTSFSVAVNAFGIGNIVTGAAILLLDTGTAAPAVTFTDNASTPNTFPQFDNPSNGAGRFLISFALKIPPGGGGGTSITCTVGGGVTVNSTQIFLDEWAGFDHVGNHAGTDTKFDDPTTTVPITSVGPNTLYWGGYFNNSGADDSTPGSGFTGLIDVNDGFWNPRTEYLIQASPGSTAVTSDNPNLRFTTIVGIVLETVPAAPPIIEAQPHFIGRYRTPIYAHSKLSEDAATTLPPQIEAQPHFISRYRTPIYVRPKLSEDHAITLPRQIEAQPHFVGRYKSTSYRWLPHFHAETDTSSSLGQHVQSAFSTTNEAAGQTSFSVTVNPLGVGNIVVGAIILILDTGASPSLVITDNAGTPNTYVQLDRPNNGAGRFLVSFALKIPPGRGGATLITCTVGGGLTVNSTQIFIDEWAGFDHVGNHAGANTSTANPITTGPIASVDPNALFWGGFFNNSGFDAVLPGSGFTGLIDANDAFWNPRTEYLLQPAPGSTAVTASNPVGDFTTIVGVVLETSPPPAAETQPHFIGRYRTSIFARPKFSEDAATTLPSQIEAQPHFITRYRTVRYLKPVLVWDTSLTLPSQGPFEVQPHFISRYRLTQYIRPRTSEDLLPFVQREAQPHFIGRYRTFIYARPRLSEDAATTLLLQREAQPHFIGRYRVPRYYHIQVSEDATGLSFTPPPSPPPTIVVAQRQYDYECSQLASQYSTGQLTVQQYYYALYALQWYFSGATDWNAFQAPMDADHVSPLTPNPSYGQSQFIGNFQGFRVVDGATLIATAQTLIALGCPRRAFPAPYPPRWAFQFYGRR